MKLYLLTLILTGFFMSTGLFAQTKAFINGKIYTVNESQPIAEAVVAKGDKIIYVGSNEGMEEFVDATTKYFDLKGKLMLPGFIDDHVHFIDGGFYLNGIDLRPAKSREEFKKILKEYADKNPGRWITGGNWDHEAWKIKELPTKELLDEVTPNTPVFVSRFDGHMAVANSKALNLAGITKETESPDGGLIVKDPQTGEPTGVLKDNAMSFVYSIIPVPSEEEYYEAAISALNHAKELGLTSVQDITYDNDLKTYRKLEDEGKLTCRIYTRMPIAEYKKLVEKGITVGTGNNMIKMGSLKAFADGSLGSSTAWFFEPYTQDPSTSGLPMDIVTNGKLKEWTFDADKNHLQLSVHAIGDKANAWMLDLYEEIKEQNPPWDRRFRIEHAQHVKFDDVKRFAEIGVIPSVQPYHAIDDGVWAEKRIGPERIKYTYPFRTFLDDGAKLCFGTDWPVAPLNPLLGIYAAVTRRTLDDKNPDGWIPGQKISVEEAVKAYTLSSAYAGFEEDIKGSIETGKLADLVVLSDDIFSIDPVKIKDVKVVMTVLGGEVIYETK